MLKPISNRLFERELIVCFYKVLSYSNFVAIGP